jgi:hypothetical protein
MPLTEVPDIICDCCLSRICTEQLVRHPTIPYWYLKICQACLISEALFLLAAGADGHRRAA